MFCVECPHGGICPWDGGGLLPRVGTRNLCEGAGGYWPGVGAAGGRWCAVYGMGGDALGGGNWPDMAEATAEAR